MCDFDFTDAKAEQICKNLGFNYGRKYASPVVTFPSGTPPLRVAFGLSCATATATGRRLRAGGVEAAAKRRDLLALDQWGEYEVDGGMPVDTFPYDATIANTSVVPTCSITVRQRCESPFYYAGVECSKSKLAAAPPPMAVPPSPPPPPPVKYHMIKEFSLRSSNLLEPNLLSQKPPVFYGGRFELDVTAKVPGALRKVWAPVCGFDVVANAAFANALALHMCKMVENCPTCLTNGYSVSSVVATPFVVPAGPYAAGEFDPNNRTHWSVITPTLPYSMARLIQDTPAPVFQVVTTPCTTLFAATCSVP
ncbi:hypothetical protein HYH03_001768 [Edaphochlamys debaryana]|uniref:SRCR domain-containing protein n=1 Tax=Edaphochlamys debaryana TaxID=47281 RepID=A0A836C5M2_9CHLO|nr:hypothetical protein HYH03_001768 [Edaphochlamys debaryana]|eukprot:KAG2500188.1 hypothetical protein HYH03_001768 [Edaphochlamys debaryana]